MKYLNTILIFILFLLIGNQYINPPMGGKVRSETTGVWTEQTESISSGTSSPYASFTGWGSGMLLELVDTSSSTIFSVNSSGIVGGDVSFANSLGIGTSAPQKILDVDGGTGTTTIRIGDVISGGSSCIEVGNTQGAKTYCYADGTTWKCTTTDCN